MLYIKVVKPLLDISLSLLVILITSPIFLTLLIILFINNKGTPFFIQKRPGKDERVFHVIKFKTMNDNRDSEGNLLSDSIRLTKIGKFIRKTSLDEIPQLINVLKGDMSLVGPRPLLVEYLPFYSTEEKQRHSVKPGITGLAQVSGRNLLHWDSRLAMDIEYVKNISFHLDLKILLLTFKKVISGSDIVVIPGNIYTPLNVERAHEYKD